MVTSVKWFVLIGFTAIQFPSKFNLYFDYLFCVLFELCVWPFICLLLWKTRRTSDNELKYNSKKIDTRLKP